MKHYFESIKYCPICGTAYLKSDWSEFLSTCHNCNYKYYHEPLPTVAVIIPSLNDLGRILLTQRNMDPHMGKFDLPGGFLKYNETPEQAGIREVKEELKVDIKMKNLFYSDQTFYEYQGYDYSIIGVYFVSEPIEELPKDLDNEIKSVVFIDKSFLENEKDKFAFNPDLKALTKYFLETLQR